MKKRRSESRRAASDVVVAFGRAVRARRLAIGMTQEQLAAAAGVNRTYIGDIERGGRNIALRNVQKLMRALGTNIGAFFVEFDIGD